MEIGHDQAAAVIAASRARRTRRDVSRRTWPIATAALLLTWV